MFHTVVGGEFGQGFLAHVAALAQAHPRRQAQFKGIGVGVDFAWGRWSPLTDPPALGCLGRQEAPLGQLGRQGGAGGQHHAIPQSPASPGFEGLPLRRWAALFRRGVERFDPEALAQGSEPHVVGREQHPIEGLMHGGGIAGADHQPGAAVLHQHLRQGPQAGGGADAAGAQPLAGLGQLQILAGLAVQKAQAVGALELQQAHGPLQPAGAEWLPIPG